MNEKLAFVIAHFHPNGKVDLSLQGLIKHFSTLTREIILVSTNINDDSKKSLTPYCKIIERENYGYDFWSYKVGIDAINNRYRLDRLVLFNNSFICLDPIKLAKNAFSEVKYNALRGITISEEKSKHIQSYWLSVEGNDLLNSVTFNDFWNSMIPITNREKVIEKYEIGLSTKFLESGIELHSIFQPTNEENLIAICRAIAHGKIQTGEIDASFRINTNCGRALNPTHYLWDKVFKLTGIIKLELIKTNPARQDIDLLISSLTEHELMIVQDSLSN